MPAPFEDPAKTEMRARCEIAIDQSGFEITDVVSVPVSGSINGGLKGDLQSLDVDGNRYCYYLRPQPSETLPKWLVNLAREAHEIQGVKLYIVAEEPSSAFQKACKVAGAGLLALTSANEVEHILDFDSTLPAAVDEAFRKELDALRRKLETKVHLQTDELKNRFSSVVDLTRGMTTELADKYKENVERQFKTWTEWGEAVAVKLDDAFAQRRQEALAEIDEEIQQGPVLDEDIS